ncbi:cupin domain-containing protein [Roseospira marina]|uniref:Cupin domain-containing protein n=1 Tax=Roseospira marina TaxID=140057 RepID=A0A5M6IC42_9PROT|nr:cupin domain-containing protein [Roseospira marina]KAA5605319.1 cupin domain-containing protein [Roseospira marina]MBB4314787.1 transcriptional regulator with XRE-family HTH domain [Roseospira marina]MBB5087776.1 transcriptional regulator with XRE-family HTH domain [Roseospira marina]
MLPPPQTPRTDDPSQFQDLGARLRAVRRQKKLRLRDVAEKANCSMSMLSKIETDHATPSLRILHRIAAALDTSIAELFSAAEASGVTVYREGERPAVLVRRAEDRPAIRLERLAPALPGQIVDGNIHVLEPGAESGGDITHAGEEIGYVLEGVVEMMIGGRTYTFAAGDSFHFNSDLPHSYRNKAEGVTRILWVNTPTTF